MKYHSFRLTFPCRSFAKSSIASIGKGYPFHKTLSFSSVTERESFACWEYPKPTPNWKLCNTLIASVCSHFKPVYQLTAFRAFVFSYFLRNPSRNPNFLHTYGIGNHIGMIANAVDNGLCAELFEFITGKLHALITSSNIVTCGAVKKSVVSTIFTTLTHKVRKATVTVIRKSWASTAKQTTYGCTLFIWCSLHKIYPHNFKVVALYRNIIAPIYKFFYYIPHLYEIAEPSTLVNGRDERASPAVDKCVRPCLCGRQGSESNESFRPCIVWFFLYLPVSFYIVI